MNLAEFLVVVFLPVLAVTRAWDVLTAFTRGDS